jgi:hypothetical protein
VYSKIYEERVVMKNVWRTHERERMGGSQRSEGHGYGKVGSGTQDYDRMGPWRMGIPYQQLSGYETFEVFLTGTTHIETKAFLTDN